MIVLEDCFCQFIFEFMACFDYLQVNVDVVFCSVVVSYDVIVDGVLVLDYIYVFIGVIIGSGDGIGIGYIFEVGLIIVVVMVINVCGEAICQFDIIVIDNLLFDVYCLNMEVDFGLEGVYYLQFEDVFDVSMSVDNCLIVEVDFIDVVFICDEEGFMFFILVSVLDLSGNSDNCIV